MRIETITRTLYSYDELSQASKEKAVRQIDGVYVVDQWWDNVYYSAEQVGVNITSFDDRMAITGELTMDVMSCIKAVMDNHGEDSRTYKISKRYLDQIMAWEEAWTSLRHDDESAYYEKFSDFMDEIHDQYREDILRAYRILLNEEYEYLSSDEAIIEFIRGNNVEFLEDGTEA